MNIIILSEKDKAGNAYYKVSDDRFHHIKNILKSEVGDTIEIGLLNQSIGTARIGKILENEIFLEDIKFSNKQKDFYNIDIVCALPRPQTLKKVLSISASMGVNNLFLIRSEKVEKSYFESPLLKEENYTKFLIEGLSQGKRIQLPKVSIHKSFKQFFDNYFSKKQNSIIKLLAHPNSKNYINQLKLKKAERYILAIGPEGGWNNFEVEFMLNIGFIPFKISKNILRVENAVSASLAQIEMILLT